MKEGILGHSISQKGFEVDREKFHVTEKFAPPLTVKGDECFLGHVGFYSRFIKDFSKIAHPLCNFYEKNITFEFYHACIIAFEGLKRC